MGSIKRFEDLPEEAQRPALEFFAEFPEHDKPAFRQMLVDAYNQCREESIARYN